MKRAARSDLGKPHSVVGNSLEHEPHRDKLRIARHKRAEKKDALYDTEIRAEVNIGLEPGDKLPCSHWWNRV